MVVVVVGGGRRGRGRSSRVFISVIAEFLCCFALVGGVAQWLGHWSMTGKLSLAYTMTCSWWVTS